MARYLIVANQTIGGDALRREIENRTEDGAYFYVVVPDTPVTDYASGWTSQVDGTFTGTPTGGTADEEARRRTRHRLQYLLGTIRDMGAEADGELGDPNPMEAMSNVVREREAFDEIIISTLPQRVSKWLGMDLPSKVKRRFDVPVTTVEHKEQL